MMIQNFQCAWHPISQVLSIHKLFGCLFLGLVSSSTYFPPSDFASFSSCRPRMGSSSSSGGGCAGGPTYFSFFVVVVVYVCLCIFAQPTWRRSSQWGDTQTASATQRTPTCLCWSTAALESAGPVWSSSLRSSSPVWSTTRWALLLL